MALLLASCSSENEPQNVSATADRTEIDCVGGVVRLTVTANCDWTVSAPEASSVKPTSGTGNSVVSVEFPKNIGYDPKERTVSITSSDGSSTASFSLVQAAEEVLTLSKVGRLPAEGGEFTVNTSTNMKNLSAKPSVSWITLKGSRALDEKAWGFTAEPNRTGKERKGKIVFQADGIDRSLDVYQDPYALDSVAIHALEENLFTGKNEFSFSFYPEHAYIGKLTAEYKLGYDAQPLEIEDGKVTVNMYVSGNYTITVYSDGQKVGARTFKVYSAGDLPSKDKKFYRGQTFTLLGEVHPSLVDGILDDPEGCIKDNGDGTFTAIKEGTASFSYFHPVKKEQVEFDIVIEKVVIVASVESYLYTFGFWQTEVYATISGKNISSYVMCLTDEGAPVVTPLAKEEKELEEPAGKVYYHRYVDVSTRSDYESFKKKIKDYRFHFNGVVDGDTVNAVVPLTLK